MIRDGVDGLLVGTVEDLARALRRLAEDPASVDALRAGIRPIPTMQQHARAIEAVYASLLRS
jgi:hypothetical protein